MLNDLTVGKPAGVILRFSLPLLLSTALQQIYNIADSVIVGQYAGAGGLAAIGAAYPITLFFVAVATGASMGASVVISQLFGAKNYRDMKSAIYTVILSLAVLGIVLAAAGVALARPLMNLLGCDAAVLEDAVAYLQIYSVGVFFMFVYNTSTAVFSGLGDSQRPLYFLLLSSVLNIVLDLLAVGAFGPLEAPGYGVAGAAWATTFSQAVAAVLSTVILVRRIQQVETEEKPAIFDSGLFWEMSAIALPSIFQQAVIALGHTFVQSIINQCGADAMAGYEAASKLHNFVYMCFNTLGIALASFVAQNYGAGKLGRIRQGYRISSLICFGLTVCVVALLQLIPAPLVRLFASEPEVVAVGESYLRIISPVYLVICFIITSGGLLRGMGLVKKFFLVTVIDLIIRVGLSFVFYYFVLHDYTGVLWAWYFGSVTDLVICLVWYRQMCRSGGVLDVTQETAGAE